MPHWISLSVGTLVAIGFLVAMGMLAVGIALDLASREAIRGKQLMRGGATIALISMFGGGIVSVVFSARNAQETARGLGAIGIAVVVTFGLSFWRWFAAWRRDRRVSAETAAGRDDDGHV